MKHLHKKVRSEFRQHKKFLHHLGLFAAGVGVFIIGTMVIWIASIRIPDFHSFEERKVASSTKIYDRTGEVLLYDIHQDVKRTNIAFADMGNNIKNATVAIEDSEFYHHQGIRITSIVRAVLSNLFGSSGTTQGGSTITQQLVKNTLLNPKKTITRKIKEWVLAIKVDHSMPKEKILEYYLNEAPYGGTIYGIEEASKTYFGKNAHALTLAEAAYLAAIPQSPTVLSPYGKNKLRLDERKNLVLSRMRTLDFITEEEYMAAKNEQVTFMTQSQGGIKAPHFVFFIKAYLEEKYGEEMVENGGLKVISTIDAKLQAKGEQIVKEGALENDKNWGGSNAALVAIDPKTGQILTMVGSRDYFDKNIEGNYNVATALRQPGSSFKPFIYATAFNKGFTPDTVLFDLPTEFSTTCNSAGNPLPGYSKESCYSPDNYDGKFRGPISLRNALAQSINIPAVKLFYLAGLQDSLKTAEDMGISTLTDISRYGLTLVIGGGEVSLLDITSAYSVFANKGVRNPYTGIIKVENMKGRILEEYAPHERAALPKDTALAISDILSDEKARIPTFGAHSPLYVDGKAVAVKTGTTNSNKDAWTIGYAPGIAVGVWAGNNNNKPMKKGGSALAGPIWNKFMKEALATIPEEGFEKPEINMDPAKVKPVLRGIWQGNENFFIDTFSGNLATENTPPEARREKVVTNVHTILYWIDRNDIIGPTPANPAKDSQFNNWEIPVRNWWARNGGGYSVVTVDQKPVIEDTVHTDSNKPTVTILSPDTTTIYNQDERITIQISSAGAFPLKKIDVFVNDTYLGSTGAPFSFSFIPSELDNLSANNNLTIVSYDTAFNRGETSTTFKIQ